MRARQIDFFENSAELSPRRISHGGSLAAKKRKLARPLDSKRPLHVVLKSSLARGPMSFLSVRQRPKIENTLRRWAQHFAVKIHFFENMGNHLHLVVSFKRRTDVQKFLKTLSAQIARLVTGARKGRPFGKRFWDHLPFTRIVTGRRDYLGVQSYFFKNKIEREHGPLARRSVELYEAAARKARQLGREIWEVLQPPG